MPRSRLLEGVRPLLWGGLLLGAAQVAPFAGAVPALRVLRGPMGFVLAAACLLAALWKGWGGRLWSRLGPRAEAAPGWLLFVLGSGFFLAVGHHYTRNLRVSGDEPHYLLMAQSLWKEGDLDLADNLARGDSREYTPAEVRPHYGAPRKDGRDFPAHSPGLPLLLAPLYAFGGRAACVTFLALAAAALALEARALALLLGAGPREALLAWFVALGPPAGFFAFHIYTEIPSALAVAVGLRLLSGATDAPRAVAAALAASALPWLHVKMVPAAVVVGLVAALRLRGRAQLVFLSVAAVAALGFLGHYHRVFGVPSPLALYGGMPRGESGSPPSALAGLMLDRSFGLLPHAPVFFVALAALARLLRGEAWSRAWPWVATAAAILLPILGWRMWWGGQSPPARFMVPVVPLLAAALALRATAEPRGLARWAWPSAWAGVALLLAMSARPGALLLLNRGDRPTRLWAALSGEWPVERYLPSLVFPDAAEVRVAVVWIAACAALLALDAAARRREAVDRAFRGLGLPLAVLLMVGVLVDAWARFP